MDRGVVQTAWRMAWGRKKSGGRKEPRFGPAASLAGLRLSPQDRIGSGEDEEAQENEEKAEEKKPKKNVSKGVSKAASKRKVEHKEGDDAPPPRERKPRESRSVSKRRSRSRFSMSI